MERMLIILAILLTGVSAGAADYASIARKAERFYAEKEWASAAAMYELMLDQRPSSATTYGRAIVTASMLERPDSEMLLMEQSLKHRVSIDSVFSAVESQSYALGRADIYERFLLLVKERQPWMTRSVDAYLLHFYTFRRTPDKMIEMAQSMLKGMPENVRFLSLLAGGYMYKGDMELALATYLKILDIDPDNYEALLELGNYHLLRFYADRSGTDHRLQALKYLKAASAIRRTPYVDNALMELSTPGKR